MKTVHINRRAAGIAVVLVLLAGFLIFTQLPASGDDTVRPLGKKVLLARDANARSIVEAEKGDSNESNTHLAKFAGSESQQRVIVEAVTVDNATEEDASRRDFIKKMMIHAWNGYKKYAWGQNEVQPISKQSHSQGIFGGSSSNFGATIIDGADTLWIMGLHDEYKEARDFIRDKFDIMSAPGAISVFETNIRFLGGILAAYALTNETFYVEKAKTVGDVLLKAFNTRSGIPKATVNAKTGAASNYGWASGASSILSEFGSLHLEFVYLSEISGNPIYKQKVTAIRDHLDRIKKVDGLYPNYISPLTGEWTGKHVSLGAMGDSFYEYLIKAYVQSDKRDEQAWRMYTETVDAIEKIMVQKSKEGLTYVAEWRNGVLEHKMGHLACFCVGMFAMQADIEKNETKKARIMKLAEEIGRTCHESYIRSETGIGPEMFYFLPGSEAKTTIGDHGYILRPEVIEGWFYLWRLTGKRMYKEWVWNATMAIEKHCRKEAGYAGLKNVYSAHDGSDDVQQSFFLAETLKYAYLTFTDKSVMSLDNWVFNTEAHPLPILRKKDA